MITSGLNVDIFFNKPVIPKGDDVIYDVWNVYTSQKVPDKNVV